MSAPQHRPLLKDPGAERALSQTGHVVLPLLGSVAAARLLEQLTQLVPSFPEGFYASVHTPDGDLRMAVNAVLMATFAPMISAACHDAALLGGAFINKAPGPRGVLPPHQDWNIVDETRHRSFNVWAPLVDTDAANGAIQVLPGSHLWLRTVRGPNLPCVYRQVHLRLRQVMQHLRVRAGEVLIYDHRLLHCSDANTTERSRPAAVLGLVPAEAELKHYFMDGKQLRQYQSSVEFLLSGQTQLRPDCLVAEAALDFDPAPVDDEHIARFLSQTPSGFAATAA